MAKISIIVPVYKVERYLHKCIDSILSQSFQDFDLILVDDGSPDNCPAVCDRYAENDKRIIVIHKKNGGLSDARNAGIDWAMEHSDSEWLAFVDSDDYLHQDYLQILYLTALEQSADLVICGFSRVNDAGELLEIGSGLSDLSTSEKEELFRWLDKNWKIVPAWNKLYHKAIFENLRFEYGKIHEDEFAIHLVLWNSKRAAVVSQALYFYRCRQNSIMAMESNGSRLDGMEAAINQYEFCLEHDLPARHDVVNAEYMDSVMDLRKRLTPEERARYLDLKRRYSRIYFSAAKNHTFMNWSRYYFNSICRRVYGIYQALREKDRKHE